MASSVPPCAPLPFALSDSFKPSFFALGTSDPDADVALLEGTSFDGTEAGMGGATERQLAWTAARELGSSIGRYISRWTAMILAALARSKLSPVARSC